jgi:phage shock protein PspC (stress-responsive transcriptional regulator)
MNDTQETPRTDGADSFDPHRLRSITDMKRSKDDRLLGGVCAGAAKYLNIDPVIVRVIVAVLTFVGFAGVILYVAAWFLLPAEGSDKSVAANWFRLDKNEEQVRVAGLVAAAVLAALAIVGDNGYAWWGVPWFLLPLAAIYYFFVVRPRRGRPDTTAPAVPVHTESVPTEAGQTLVEPRQPLVYPPSKRERRSGALSLLTVSVAAIAVASTRIYAEYHDGVPWTAYIAIALGVTALGLLIGTFFGHGGPLIALGIVLSIALGLGSLLPNVEIGDEKPTPLLSSQVKSTYQHGIGEFELDLTQVSDPGKLLGRDIEIQQAIGQIRVIVPTGLNVRVDSRLDAGEIRIFDRKTNGTQTELDYPAAGTAPALTLDIHQRLGDIEVIRR